MRWRPFAHPAQVTAFAAALVSLVPLSMSGSGTPGTGLLLLGWGAFIVSGSIGIGLSVRLAMTAGPAPAVRRFWRHVSVSITLVAAGGLSDFVFVLRPDPSSALGAASPYLVVPSLAGMLVLLRGLLVLPSRPRSRTEWQTFGFDAGTVLVGSSLVAWHLTALSVGGGATPTLASVPVIGLLAVGFTGVLVALKLTFAGVTEIDLRSLQLLAGSAMLGGVLGAFAMVVTANHPTNITYVPMAWSYLLVTAAALQQRQASSQPQPGPVARPARPVRQSRQGIGRAFALLPYLAVAVTDAILLGHSRADAESAVVAAGAVLLTGFVLARQIVASRELKKVLGRLDTTVGELRSSEALLTFQASHDALTGLPNRILLRSRIDEALAAASAPAEIAVALVDLDDFKVVNDRLGHEIGDELLIGIAGRLNRAVAFHDTVARLGGDEFAIVLTGLRPRDLDARVQLLLDALTEPLDVSGHEIVVRASVGVSPAAGTFRAEELLRRADVAMYAAKDTTGSSWAEYAQEMDGRAIRHAEVGAGLRHGLDNHEFRLHYQPIVSLPDGRVRGVEALVRWQHPDSGPIPPNEFIPIAENSGLIVPLGHWILTEACRQAARWRAELGERAPAYVSVNISPRQLAEETIVADVAAALADSGLPARCLMLEVTETAVFAGGPALAALADLRALGIRIALDDFGTGHSSLGLLLSCPVDVLKLDKSFVDDITGSGRPVVIATFLSDVARGLDLQTIAEGVESAAQASRLHELGYELAQGYLFSRPVPAVELTALLTAATGRFDEAPRLGADPLRSTA